MPRTKCSGDGDGEIRTLDPLLARQVLSQLSYTPGLKKRRRRDLNPRAVISDLLPFQGSPFNHLGTSAKVPCLNEKLLYERSDFCSLSSSVKVTDRRGWDSNPCALADKRFSRPPRYDHFDTSPNVLFYSIGMPFICQVISGIDP